MRKTLVLGLCWAGLVASASADTIFNNATNDLAVRFDPGPLEIGDEITLTGNARYLTNFAFEYWGTNPANATRFSGDVDARVRFYRNDGPVFAGYAAPGTLIWDSRWFPISPTPRNVLVFAAGADFPANGLYLPCSRLTWTVQFRGLGETDSAGVDFYSPPVSGGFYPDYWENNEGAWTLRTNLYPADFAALLEATLVPDPPLPQLQIETISNQLRVSWPGWATNFVPETSSSLAPGSNWTVTIVGIRWVDNNFVLTPNLEPGPAFFRLRKL